MCIFLSVICLHRSMFFLFISIMSSCIFRFVTGRKTERNRYIIDWLGVKFIMNLGNKLNGKLWHWITKKTEYITKLKDYGRLQIQFCTSLLGNQIIEREKNEHWGSIFIFLRCYLLSVLNGYSLKLSWRNVLSSYSVSTIIRPFKYHQKLYAINENVLCLVNNICIA